MGINGLKFQSDVAFLQHNKKIMADITELNKERQRLMVEFLQVKNDLVKAREELENLRVENGRLNGALEEREEAFQNLFGYLQEVSQ